MNDRKSWRKRTVVIGAIVGVIVVGAIVLWCAFEPVHLRVRLLCRTDHDSLLAACQELSTRIMRGQLDPGKYRVRFWPARAVSQFPAVIRSLRPAYVFIDPEGRVVVEMFGGLTNFGVYAYPESYDKPRGFTYGNRELRPNLWYYDDEYHKDPQFDEKIDVILRKCKETSRSE